MRPFNFKLDPVTVEALRALEAKHATSAASVVRMAIREKAERDGVVAARRPAGTGGD